MNEPVEEAFGLRDELAVLLVAKCKLAQHPARHALAVWKRERAEDACRENIKESRVQCFGLIVTELDVLQHGLWQFPKQRAGGMLLRSAWTSTDIGGFWATRRMRRRGWGRSNRPSNTLGVLPIRRMFSAFLCAMYCDEDFRVTRSRVVDTDPVRVLACILHTGFLSMEDGTDSQAFEEGRQRTNDWKVGGNDTHRESHASPIFRVIVSRHEEVNKPQSHRLHRPDLSLPAARGRVWAGRGRSGAHCGASRENG